MPTFLLGFDTEPMEAKSVNALPRGERAVGDRFDQLLIGTVDQCRLGVEMLHPGTAAFEFGILT